MFVEIEPASPQLGPNRPDKVQIQGPLSSQNYREKFKFKQVQENVKLTQSWSWTRPNPCPLEPVS